MKNELIFRIYIREMPKHVLFVDGLIGGGKCLSPNTLVAMYNGTVKKAKKIQINDELLGDDSTKRIVLSICSGNDTMYNIIPKLGDSFIANEPHILTLKCPYNPNLIKGRNRSGKISRYRVSYFDKTGTHAKDFTFSVLGEELAYEEAQKYQILYKQKFDIFDISINEFLKKSKSWQSNCQLYHVGFDWPAKKVPLNPYVYGIWLGDGSQGAPDITNIDTEILDYYSNFGTRHDLEFKKRGNTITYGFSSASSRKHGCNYFINQLRELNCYEDKHIADIYLTNSRKIRLKLLAGLIDSDGYCSRGRTYEIVQKRKILAYQIAFLTRSLGFMTNIRQVEKTCVNNGVKGIYYRTTFWGDGLEELTQYLLLDRKKITHLRETQVTPNVSAFKIEQIGTGPYCGFTLDGNGRFLLGDFTVTHNTTFLTKIKEKYPHLTVIYEPVEKWMSSGLLEKFYNDPKKYCFQLQSFIMDSFVDELEKAFEKDIDFILFERGHLAAYTIFSYIHWRNGILSDQEYKLMEEKHYIYDRDLRERGYVLDHIYLNTPIDTAMERIAIRNRGNEKESISRAYQEGFLKRYEELCLTPYSLEQLNDLIDKLVLLQKRD